MKKQMGWLAVMVVVGFLGILCARAMAQDAAPAAAGAAAPAVAAAGNAPAGAGTELKKDAEEKPKVDTSFMAMVLSSGWLGVALWLGLLGALISMIYFTIDCSMTVRTVKIVPPELIRKVNECMQQGDVFKALQSCKDEPSPMANILAAGLSHVEDGYEVIQEAVTVAAEFESEKLMQHISWLSVTAALAPMLGLLGTVQGMIMAFETIATGGGAQTGMLALSISQALWTTAAGLTVAIPAITAFTVFRNFANKATLRMQAITMDLIKDLRNVEVVPE
jgi:biopolymer transport protein ExbB